MVYAGQNCVTLFNKWITHLGLGRTEKICAGYRVRKLKSGPDPGLPNAEWVTQYFQLISGNMPIGSQAIDQTAISKTHLPL